MTAETYERVRDIVARHLGVPADRVKEDASLEDLGVDSLGALELIFHVEEEFQIVVPNDRASGFTTIRSVCDGIETLQQARTGASA